MVIAMETLRRCPCGEIPESICIQVFHGPKETRVFAYPSCCSVWHVELNVSNIDIFSINRIKLAIDAWNNAPRQGY
jgi:hypothetical protein